MKRKNYTILLLAPGSGRFRKLHLSPHLVWGVGVAIALLLVAALTIPRLIGFFLLVNAAVMNAWFYHLSGQRAVKWEPTRR